MIRPLFWLTLMLCAGAAGCSSTPPRYYLLNAMDALETTGADRPARAIGLEKIELPGYLDQTRMVRRTGSNTLTIHSLDQWGEPLDEGTQRVLAANLRRLLPEAEIHPTPWPRGFRHDYRLRVLITSFDSATDGAVQLSGSWTLLAGEQSGRTRFDIQLPSQGNSHGEVAAAMSQALMQLSEEIAQALQSL